MSSFNFFSLGGFLLRKNQAFQGYVRTSCYLHSFATLRNWLRQPLQSLPLFKIKKLEIEPKFQNWLLFSVTFLVNLKYFQFSLINLKENRIYFSYIK